MKSLSVASLLLLLAVFAISTEAAFPKRTLLQDTCTDACNAVLATDPNTLQVVISQDSDVCACLCNGEPLLHAAVRRCIACIEILISSPASCQRDTTDSSGNTATHLMASLCQLGVDGELIRLEFPLQSKNNDGDTPLCLASRANDPNCGQVSRLLIAEDVDTSSNCSDGLTPCRGCVDTNVCNVIGDDTMSTCPGP
eukprot:g3765.t1